MIKETAPVGVYSYIILIPLEYNIEIENKFEVMMPVQECKTQDELATQTNTI